MIDLELELSSSVSLAPRKRKNWSRVSPVEPEATMLRSMAMDIGDNTTFSADEPLLDLVGDGLCSYACTEIHGWLWREDTRNIVRVEKR